MKNFTFLMVLLYGILCFSQDKDIFVTDVRINLFDAGKKTDGEVIIQNCFRDPKFIDILNDSIRVGLINQLHSKKVFIDANSLVFIKGLTKVPFKYKEVTNNDVGYYLIIETSIGLTDVLRYEEYEIVTTIKILDQKKKKLLKVTETVNLPDEHDQTETFKINSNNFSVAFLNSIMKTIKAIQLPNK